MTKHFKIEVLFWAITFVICLLILAPVYLEYSNHYPFYIPNFVVILLFLTLTRYIFLLRWSPFSHNKTVKKILVFAMIPVLMYLVQSFFNFQDFLDETGFHSIPTTHGEITSIDKAYYSKIQYLFFISGAIITSILFPIRMIISIWRQTNKNTI